MIATQTSGHPVWHFGIVAVVALVAFGTIQVAEWWSGRRVRRAERPRSELPSRQRPKTILLIAAASVAAAWLHAAVCPEHFRESAAFGVFFLAAAAFQAGWAIVVLTRPTRAALLAGAVANLAIVIIWLISRTTGLPVGPEVWEPEAIGAADVLSTALELAVAVGVGLQLRRRSFSPA